VGRSVGIVDEPRDMDGKQERPTTTILDIRERKVYKHLSREKLIKKW